MLDATVTDDDAPPSVWIDDRYELRELIGEGRTSFVYRAEHLALRRSVAIKILRPELANDPAQLARFRLTGIAGARVAHPNAVRCLDGGVTGDGRPFLVTELVVGPSLAQVLRAPGAPSKPRMLRLMSQLLSVLAAAAAVGVVHDDVAPDRVIVETGRDGRERVRLLHLGRSEIAGDPGQLAPGTSLGPSSAPATDVHALGVICLLLAVSSPCLPRRQVRRAPPLRPDARRMHGLRAAA